MFRRIFPVLAAALTLSACAETELAAHMAKGKHRQEGLYKVGNPYDVQGRTYYPQENFELVETGIASWYGTGFHGKRTANGEMFDENELTAAHRTLQMPSLIRVTNLDNGRSLIVRVNDRGPFSRGRVLDVSKKAAELLGFKGRGTAKVKIEVMPEASRKIAAAAKQGIDTSGVEIAMNQHGDLPPAMKRGQVQLASYSQAGVKAEAIPAGVPGHMNQGRFMPDPMVQQGPVIPTSIFVQGGSFTNYENAMRMKQTLARFGSADVYPAQIRGQQFYRVRLGPLPTVEQADTVLNSLIAQGNQTAIIVVD